MRVYSCQNCGQVRAWCLEGPESIERRRLEDACNCERRLVRQTNLGIVRREIDEGLLIVYDERRLFWDWVKGLFL